MADKYAIRSWCAGLGGFTPPPNPTELVKKGELNQLNCTLVPTPSMQYASNQYVLQKDIKKAEGTVFRTQTELIQASIFSDLGVTFNQIVTYTYSENTGWGIPSYSGGEGHAVGLQFFETNLGYYLQGGTYDEEYGTTLIKHRLIVLNSRISIITTGYWDHNPENDNIPQAYCQVSITYEDRTNNSVTVHYAVESSVQYGSPQNGKYQYKIDFKNDRPHISTSNKKITEVIVMYSLWGDA